MDELEQLLAEREIKRSRTHPDPTIQRALALLGQDVNPITLVSTSELGDLYRASGSSDYESVSDVNRLKNVSGARLPNDPNIYVNKEHPVYGKAASGEDALADLILASLLVHEQTHETEKSEYPSNRLQADWLKDQIDRLPKSQRDKARQAWEQRERRAQLSDFQTLLRSTKR